MSPCSLGDALLVYGPREKLFVLGEEPDFLVLTEAAQEATRSEQSPVGQPGDGWGVCCRSLVGWLPIAIAAVIWGGR